MYVLKRNVLFTCPIFTRLIFRYYTAWRPAIPILTHTGRNSFAPISKTWLRCADLHESHAYSTTHCKEFLHRSSWSLIKGLIADARSQTEGRSYCRYPHMYGLLVYCVKNVLKAVKEVNFSFDPHMVLFKYRTALPFEYDCLFQELSARHKKVQSTKYRELSHLTSGFCNVHLSSV